MPAVEVHAEVSGSERAPAVLLIGSLGSTLEMWDPQLPALSEHRVIRHDTRGHGRSPVPAGPYAMDDLVDDAVALLGRLGVEQVHVVGLSLGGMIALRLAAREPDRISSAVVLCTAARLAPASAWTDRAAAVRAGGTGAVADAVVARWFTDAFRERQPDVVAATRDMIASTPVEGYAACCEAIGSADLREDLRDVRCPLLAIAGADDPATPPEHLSIIADGVPDGRVVVLPQAAHLASVEQSDAVNELLVAHLSRQL